MGRLRKFVACLMILALCACLFAGCSTENHQRGPLDVRKVTYLIYAGGINQVEMYVLTSDRKVTHYVIRPEADKSYDYLAGEMPSSEYYEVTESETTVSGWESVVNVLTRVNYMELKEDVSDTTGTDDAASYYIKVETEEDVHISGGYNAGYMDDSESRRFAEARQYVENALNQ